MLVVNHAIFILICHNILKVTFSMKEEPNPTQKQSKPLDFIAIRDTVEEDILDLQPVMTTAGDSLEENLINGIAENRLPYERFDPYNPFRNQPQENYGAFRNKASYSGKENHMVKIDKNMWLRNAERGLPSHLVPHYVTRDENFPFVSREMDTFGKGTDLTNSRIDFIRKLNGNKRSLVLKHSEEFNPQSHILDRFSNQQKVLQDKGRKPVRRTENWLQKHNSFRNYPLDMPRQPFSEDVMHHEDSSNDPRQDYQSKSKDQKLRYHRPKTFQNMKLNRTIPSNKLLKREPLSENQNTSNPVEASNMQMPDNKLINQLGHFIEKMDNNVVSKIPSKATQMDNSTTIEERYSNNKPSRITEKKTAVTEKSHHLGTFLKNKAHLSNKVNNLSNKQNEVTELNILEHQKSKRINLFNTLQGNTKNLDSFTKVSQINDTTEDIIQIEFLGDFATDFVNERERKALMNRKEKSAFESWQKPVFILIGLAGFTGLILIAACIYISQYVKKKQTRCKEIVDSKDFENVGDNSEKGSRNSEETLKNIYRSMSKYSKGKPQRESPQKKHKRAHFKCENQILDAMYVGNLNNLTEYFRTEGKLPMNNVSMRYVPKDASQERFTPRVENENYTCFQESVIENTNNFITQKSASDGNFCRQDINLERKVTFYFDKNDGSQGLITDTFSKGQPQQFQSESSFQNVPKDNSESESNESAIQSSSDGFGKLKLPSLPSVSSSTYESDTG